MTLRWAAPPGCPAEDDVRARLAAHLGPAAPGQVYVTVTATVEGDERRGFTARLESGAGRRSLEAPSCETLAGAVVVASALLADPRVVPPPAPAPPPPTTPTPSAPAPAAPPASRRPARSPERVTYVGPRGLAAWGLLPEAPATGVGLAVGRQWGELRAEARATYWPESNAYRSAISLAAFSLALCDSWGWARLRFEACGGAEAGRFAARGVDTVRPTAATALWAAVTAGGAVRWQATERWGFALEPGFALPPSRPRFVFDDDKRNVLHQPSSITFRLGAGVNFFF